ncbi:MAG: hypothetical protein V4850_29730 [Myxococcota bacterium]
MAGELLIQLFDEARFSAVESTLAELDSTRKLSAAARAQVESALRADLPDRTGGGLDVLRRILAEPGLDPRVFLTPRELDDAIEALVLRACFERAGEYSLAPIGPSWVVLDSVQRDLIDRPWFTHIFWEEDHALAHRIRYPARGESAAYELTPEGMRFLVESIDSLPTDWTPVDWFREQIAALRALAAEAQRRAGWTLAFRGLL